jgi:hypothetical protein
MQQRQPVDYSIIREINTSPIDALSFLAALSSFYREQAI